MVVVTQHPVHVILENLDDQHEDLRSAVGSGQADLADHDVVFRPCRKAQRFRLREPRFMSDIAFLSRVVVKAEQVPGLSAI
jgi:hypothetical protein